MTIEIGLRILPYVFVFFVGVHLGMYLVRLIEKDEYWKKDD